MALPAVHKCPLVANRAVSVEAEQSESDDEEADSEEEVKSIKKAGSKKQAVSVEADESESDEDFLGLLL